MKRQIIISAIFLFSIAAFSQLVITDGTDLYVNSGTSLYVSTDINSDNATLWNFGTIDLKGSLVNNSGSLFNVTSSGTFMFSGTTPQEITGNHDAGFYGIMEINNSIGLGLTSTYTGADQSVYGELIFTSGKITLNEFNLFLGDVEPTGISENKHFQTNGIGSLKREVPADEISMVYFPVGNTSFNPIYLLNNSIASTDIYGVRVIDQEPAGLSTPYFVDRSWVITEEIPGGSGLKLKPFWNLGEELTDFNRNYCAVGRVNIPGSSYDWGTFGNAFGENPYFHEGETFAEVGIFAVGNLPPVAICQNLIVSADENCEGNVTAEQFDNGSYDPDGNPINFSLDPSGPYPLGETIVTLTVTDEGGAFDQCTTTILIDDVTAPLITTKNTTMEFIIWPPNHKYQSFDIIDFVLSVNDNCELVSNEEVYIAKATSDEPENEVGTGDGETLYDILIADDCKSIQLRKERQGVGNGRIYTIHLELDDGNGNIGTATCQVQVPHNNGATAIDDGAVYEVLGNCFGKSSFITSKDNDNTELKVYPNPFKEKTTISFIISEDNITSLNVYNIYGIEISRLFEGNAVADTDYRFTLNEQSLSPGIYIIHLQSGRDVNLIRKVYLMR